jgi:signal recognition particle GTPase
VLTAPAKSSELDLGNDKPAVLLVVGVNGGGKTTTIGKLAHKFTKQGAKVGCSQMTLSARKYLKVWTTGYLVCRSHAHTSWVHNGMCATESCGV